MMLLASITISQLFGRHIWPEFSHMDFIYTYNHILVNAAVNRHTVNNNGAAIDRCELSSISS